MKRGSCESFVPDKKRKTSARPESPEDDIEEEACEDGEAAIDVAAQDAEEVLDGEAVDVMEEFADDAEAAPDEEAEVDGQVAAEQDVIQDEDAVADEDVVLEEEEVAEEEEVDDQVAGEQDAIQDEDMVADDDVAFHEEAVEEEAAEDEAVAEDATAELAWPEVEAEFEEEGVPGAEELNSNDKAASREGEVEPNEVPDAAQAELDELAKLGHELESAQQAAQDGDSDDAPAVDFLQDKPDSDSSDSDSSDSTSASSGKAAAVISDGSSLLDLLGGGSNLPAAEAAEVLAVQEEEAEDSSPAAKLELKLASDLAKAGPKKKAARLAQLSKWLWDRQQASSLPSGLEAADEVEALILRIAGEPGEDVPQPLTPPRKAQRKSGGAALKPRNEPKHRDLEQEPLWPILNEHRQYHGLSARFAKKKALSEIAPVQSFRDEDLWFQNPGQSVSCEWCENEVPQSFGNLQGAEGQSTFSQCEFVCFTCIEEYGCGE